MSTESTVEGGFPRFEMADSDIVSLKSILNSDDILMTNVCAEMALLREAEIEVCDVFDGFSESIDRAIRDKAVTAAQICVRLMEAVQSDGAEWPEGFIHPSVVVMGLDQVAKHINEYAHVNIYG